jgi:hypothetical protein
LDQQFSIAGKEFSPIVDSRPGHVFITSIDASYLDIGRSRRHPDDIWRITVLAKIWSWISAEPEPVSPSIKDLMSL